MAKIKDEPKTSVAVNDAWTGMLVVSLVALIIGSVLVFLDWQSYNKAPDKLRLSAPVTQQQDEETAKDQPPPAQQPPGAQPGQPVQPGQPPMPPQMPPGMKGPGKKG